MHKTLALIALCLGFGAPALANSQMETALDLPPGVYTTAELSQLMAEEVDRNRRLELIHAKRARFEAAVKAIQNGTVTPTASTSGR